MSAFLGFLATAGFVLVLTYVVIRLFFVDAAVAHLTRIAMEKGAK